MKKTNFVTLLFLAFAFVANGQNESDALKFSQFLPSGTARYTAMGGAFSALGGDLSVMATNPAGIGLYRKNDIGISTTWTNNTTDSKFMGVSRNAEKLSFQISNLGFVAVSPINSSGWKSVNFGFAYNHLNDYNRAVSVQGNNLESSMLDYQVDYLNSNSDQADNNAYYLADAIYYDTVINRYVNDYQHPVSNYGAEQMHQLVTGGYAGEYDFNVSGNYNDVLFVGATMAFQHINYDQTTFHSETPFNETESTSLPLQTFSSNDYLSAIGNGFSLKLGVLYKITHALRIGAALHTPTFYNFEYDYWTNVNATVGYDNGVFNNTGESPRGEYEWNFKAPARYIFSSSYVIGDVGVVSGEVEYLNYSSMNISAADYYFVDENQNIKNIYDKAVNARFGAEVKIGIASLRGGIGYLDSPYKNTEPNANAYKLLFSGGLGINMGMAYFDATYQYVTGDEFYYMYGYETSKVDISNQNHKFMATLGFRF
jgi:hypothetical protein